MTEYGENGFIPTVNAVKRSDEGMVFETIDPRRESDIISKEGEPLKRRGDYLSDEQQDKMVLRE